jgi:hypothetical protein
MSTDNIRAIGLTLVVAAALGCATYLLAAGLGGWGWFVFVGALAVFGLAQ